MENKMKEHNTEEIKILKHRPKGEMVKLTPTEAQARYKERYDEAMAELEQFRKENNG